MFAFFISFGTFKSASSTKKREEAKEIYLQCGIKKNFKRSFERRKIGFLNAI